MNICFVKTWLNFVSSHILNMLNLCQYHSVTQQRNTSTSIEPQSVHKKRVSLPSFQRCDLQQSASGPSLWKSYRGPATFFNSQQRPDTLTSLQDNKKQRSSLYVGTRHIFAILREIWGSLDPCSCSNNKDSFQGRKRVCFYRLDRICFTVH